MKKGFSIVLLIFFLLAFTGRIFSQKRSGVDTNLRTHEQIDYTPKIGKGPVKFPLDSGWILVSETSKRLSAKSYDWIFDFRANRAACQSGNKWGFIDKNGVEVIPTIYDAAQDFNEQTKTAYVLNGDQWIEIDLEGKQKRKMPVGFQVNPVAMQSFRALQNSAIPSSSSLNRATALQPCPPNVGFENGNFTNWKFYTGTVDQRCIGGLNVPLLTQVPNAVPGRHRLITSSSVPDYFGGFERRSPDGSNYFLQLGNNINGCQAEAVSYEFQIPANAPNYSITYYYAVVFENPEDHDNCEQPRFMARVKDANTGAYLPCSSFDYTANPSLPGFLVSPRSGNMGSTVLYKPWSSAYISLGQYSGRRVILEFVTTDCGLCGHFGYAYFDIPNICDLAAQGITQCNAPNQTTLTGPPGFQTYAWYNQNLTTQIGTGNPFVVNPGPPEGTQYQLILTPYTGFGCRDTVPVVTAKLYPDAEFTAPPSQCLRGNRFTFTSSSTTAGNSTLTNQLWRFGDGQTATGSTVTHTYLQAGTYSVTLIVTNSANCEDTVTYTVEVKDSPSASFTAPSDQCLRNNLFAFTSNSSLTSGTINSLTWNFGDGNSATGANVTHSYTSPGTYPVRLIAEANNGCKDTIIRNVLVNPQPRASFSAPSAQCLAGNSFTFTSTSSVVPGSLVSQTWNLGNTATASGTTVTYSYPASGNYSVLLNVVSDKGCIDTVRRTVAVYDDPSVIVTSNRALTFCQGDSILLLANGQAGSGNLVSFQWYRNGTIIPGATGNQITVKLGGTYSVMVTNTYGCTKTSANTVVVVHPLPVGNLQLPSQDYICAGSPVTLTANGGATYQWYLNGASISGANSSTFNALLPGLYEVDLISAEGCINRAQGTIRLKLYNRPTVDFSYPGYCVLQPINFKNLSDTLLSGNVTWLWNFGGAATSVAFEPTHTFTNAGSQVVSLTATPIKCPILATTSQKTIPVESPTPGIRYPAVNALFDVDKQLSARNIGIKYEWAPIIGLNNHKIRTPIYRSQYETDFLIRIEAASGCVTIDTQLVRIFKSIDIFVPKAFSPNGDNHNDRLDIFLVGISRLIYFRVFNRWGQLLYETNDPAQRWDGTYKGVKQPLETYVWIAEGIGETGEKIVRRGQTILLR